MKAFRWGHFWAQWGIVPRLMAGVGFAILLGGGVQTYLHLVDGAVEHSARHRREHAETLQFLAPLVADQAILGGYDTIEQLLRTQVTKGDLARVTWTDRAGKKIS